MSSQPKVSPQAIASKRGRLADVAHRTAQERVEEALRQAILGGDLSPGEPLVLGELSAQLGVSRTPIREAFRQLETEGFITVVPRKGAIVASLSPREIAEFYDLKMVLEGYAARCAAATLTESDLTKMETVNRQIEAASEKKDLRRLLDLHNEFHDIFLRSCGNEKLHTIVQNLVMQFRRFRLILAMPGKIEGSIRQHWEIIDAFRKRDPELAEELVRKNALYGKKLLLRELAKA